MTANGLKHPVMAVKCPACGAEVGKWCRRPSGHSGPMVAFHAARRKAAQEAAEREEVQVTVEVVLTPADPRWREFIRRLEGPEGCDFRKGEYGEYSWRCAGGRDQSLSRAILTDMGGIDVEGTLGYFDQHGGYCDCEVVFYVNRHDD